MSIPELSGSRTDRAPTTPPQTVDQSKVDIALRNIQADIPVNDSQLANALTNPNLNQAEKDQIVQTLARGDETSVKAFYANDVNRSTRDEDVRGLGEDQATIGQALQQAYKDGVITADDLVHISDFNGVGNGGQRVMDTLQAGGGGGVNGTVEALSDALWARNGNDGTDRAVATIGYTSDPMLQARNLTTPEQRRDAFEALVDFNDKAPYDQASLGDTGKAWQQSALASEGRLFTANSSELIDYYTGANGGVAQTETLSRFVSQTVLNPAAQGIWMDRREDLVPAIRDAFDASAGRFLDGAKAPGVTPLEQERLIGQFGRLTASVSGGAALALTAYSDQINANKESREAFVGTVGDLVGLTKLGDVTGADKATDYLAGKLFDAMTEQPDRPDSALAGVLFDNYAGQVDQLATELNQTGLRPSFDSAYASEVVNLQQNLNVNLGGQEK